MHVQAVYICNEIAVCRSTRRRAQRARARTTRTATSTPTRCTSRATPTEGRRPGLRKSASGLLDGQSAGSAPTRVRPSRRRRCACNILGRRARSFRSGVCLWCGSLALTLTQTSEGGERWRSGGMTDTHPGLKMHILCFSSVWRSLGGWQRAKVGIRERERLVGGAGKHAAIRK